MLEYNRFKQSGTIKTHKRSYGTSRVLIENNLREIRNCNIHPLRLIEVIRTLEINDKRNKIPIAIKGFLYSLEGVINIPISIYSLANNVDVWKTSKSFCEPAFFVEVTNKIEKKISSRSTVNRKKGCGNYLITPGSILRMLHNQHKIYAEELYISRNIIDTFGIYVRNGLVTPRELKMMIRFLRSAGKDIHIYDRPMLDAIKDMLTIDIHDSELFDLFVNEMEEGLF